jgi:hypothetical protein
VKERGLIAERVVFAAAIGLVLSQFVRVALLGASMDRFSQALWLGCAGFWAAMAWAYFERWRRAK